MEELEFWNEKMVKWLVPIPNPCLGVEDSLLVLMEECEGVGDFYECVTVD
jgi:hypothetical protein